MIDVSNPNLDAPQLTGANAIPVNPSRVPSSSVHATFSGPSVQDIPSSFAPANSAPPLTGANVVPLPQKRAVFHCLQPSIVGPQNSFYPKIRARPWSEMPRPSNPALIASGIGACFRCVSDACLMIITGLTTNDQLDALPVFVGDIPLPTIDFKRRLERDFLLGTVMRGDTELPSVKRRCLVGQYMRLLGRPCQAHRRLAWPTKWKGRNPLPPLGPRGESSLGLMLCSIPSPTLLSHALLRLTPFFSL